MCVFLDTTFVNGGTVGEYFTMSVVEPPPEIWE
jgi:hypothetical protein